MLVAKCAFSEQRNDSYVLAAVITGTLPRAELTEKTEWCSCSYSGFHEWSTFFVPGENFDNMQRVKNCECSTGCAHLFHPPPQLNSVSLYWRKALFKVYGSVDSIPLNLG